jgi:hypothetical protein
VRYKGVLGVTNVKTWEIMQGCVFYVYAQEGRAWRMGLGLLVRE